MVKSRNIITNNTNNSVLNDRRKQVLKEDTKLKMQPFVQSITSVATGANIYTYGPLVGLGILSNQRIGDIIRLRRADFRFNMVGGDNTNVMRIFMVYNKGLPPTGVLSDWLNVGASGTQDVTSILETYLKHRNFEVLYDQTWTLCVNSNTANHAEEFSIPINRDIVFSYNNTTSVSGQLFLVAISDSGVVPHPQLNMNCIVWYSDL
jgi:hypothetical protein